ncbi:MAG: polyprenol monophosphomannose synthase [Kiritimatiellae bacterium]|nr:polyprenol monophosphomannose synthase [Kiritimatiellia bacterium]
MMKTIVVIPTYDEKDNVGPMAEAVLKNAVELLFVDDNSPDGTGAVIDELAAKEPRIHVLHREKKEGLGRAYVAGFSKALELGAELVVQMDCDFSHDPKDVARLVEAITTPIPSKQSGNSDDEKKFPDLVIGSRYVPGGSTPGWPFKRRLISRAGGIFIRTVTGMPVRDPTGGFKCWRKTTLEKIDFTTVASAGYSFQLEMNHRTWKAGLFIKEIPIAFTDRVAGYSKITAGIAKESLKIAWRLRRFF